MAVVAHGSEMVGLCYYPLDHDSKTDPIDLWISVNAADTLNRKTTHTGNEVTRNKTQMKQAAADIRNNSKHAIILVEGNKCELP